MLPTTIEDDPEAARRAATAHLPTETRGRLVHDRSGTILAQTMVLLPVLVLIAFGGFEIMRAMAVKQALHDGTYQAARYLALNPINDQTPRAWEEVAELFVMQALTAEVGEIRAHQGLVDVHVQPPGTIPACGDIEIEVIYNWTVDIPYMPELNVIPLRERYRARTLAC